jgi:hypothetical protein
MFFFNYIFHIVRWERLDDSLKKLKTKERGLINYPLSNG